MGPAIAAAPSSGKHEAGHVPRVIILEGNEQNLVSEAVGHRSAIHHVTLLAPSSIRVNERAEHVQP